MKKILAFALALAMILTCSFALADRLDASNRRWLTVAIASRRIVHRRRQHRWHRYPHVPVDG
ncbi:MAG: hypothetical protein ACLTV6_15840 [Christensenellales bacterium]